MWILSGCLKLLPPDQLEHLDLPVNEKSRSHVKKVVYFSENVILDVGGNNTLSRQESEGTRFNLFTGNQTFDQREKSFKVMRAILTSLTMFKIIDDCYHVNVRL